MRTSILNTATTEQMGYVSISFFVCFPLMNQIVDLFFFVYYNSASVVVLNQYISEGAIFSEIDFLMYLHDYITDWRKLWIMLLR